MCTICSTFRPFDTGCSYDAIGPQAAAITEIVSSPASISTLNTMALGDSFSGALQTVGDDDWVAVTLQAGTSYEINLFGVGIGALSDPYLRLYDDTGAQVAFNDDGGSGYNSRIIYTPTSTETYFISARSYNDAGAGAYQITVAAAAPSAVGSLEDLAAYLTDGYWDDNGGSRHTFDTTTSNVITVNITALPADAQRLARWAMEAWERVADIRFSEVGGSAQITFTDNQPGAYSSYSSIGGTTQSAIVNVSATWLANYGTQIDDYSFSTYLHELGHALGLGHQGDYNGAATYGVDETFANDSYQVSIMSYFSQTENTFVNASYGQPITAMIADIIAIQDLYGAPGGTGDTAGNTVYGVGQTIGGYLGALFDALLSGQDPNNYYGDSFVALTLYDQGGTDTVNFSTDGTDQEIDLRSGAIWDTFGRIGNVVVAANTVIENYIAGAGNDRIVGNGAFNALYGGGGQDTLLGLDGNDRLSGDGGDDLLYGQYGNDVLIGGDGNDTLYGHADRDVLRGGEGADTLYGMWHNDTLYGGNGDDLLNGGSQDDVLYGNSGNDTLDGSTGSDWLGGGYGDDLLRAGKGRDSLFGGYGNDLLAGGQHSDTLEGGAGNDTLWGGDGNDTLMGGGGNDRLVGGAHNDDFVFAAGFGRDTIADFENDRDEIFLDDALWAGNLTAQQVINSFATASGNSTVLNFGGGNLIVLAGVNNAQDLVDDIVIF